jgi:exodeoxyribonuclease VII small subunit
MKKTFEEQIKELEEIVSDLESGNTTLDDSIEKYTQAMKLVNDCDKKLKNIEEKVTKILKENGNLEEFEVES